MQPPVVYIVIDKKNILGVFDNEKDASNYVVSRKSKAKIVQRITNTPIA